jgi:hypothetical protein
MVCTSRTGPVQAPCSHSKRYIDLFFLCRFEFRNRLPLQNLNSNASSNSNLASPTPMAKQPPVHHFLAKDDNQLSFQDAAANDEYFDNSGRLGDVGALNPLCVQGRDYGFGVYNATAYHSNMNAHISGFQSINGTYPYGRMFPGHDGMTYPGASDPYAGEI